jgi:hypothetical protein
VAVWRPLHSESLPVHTAALSATVAHGPRLPRKTHIAVVALLLKTVEQHTPRPAGKPTCSSSVLLPSTSTSERLCSFSASAGAHAGSRPGGSVQNCRRRLWRSARCSAILGRRGGGWGAGGVYWGGGGESMRAGRRRVSEGCGAPRLHGMATSAARQLAAPAACSPRPAGPARPGWRSGRAHLLLSQCHATVPAPLRSNHERPRAVSFGGSCHQPRLRTGLAAAW